MKITYFISGHLDLTKDEFEQHYIPMIETALKQGANFVVGDARGADTMSQNFLSSRTKNVYVYHMLERPRYNAGFKTIGGFTSDSDRDQAMTSVSDVDIAWIRPGREKSGTAKNIKRRKCEQTKTKKS